MEGHEAEETEEQKKERLAKEVERTTEPNLAKAVQAIQEQCKVILTQLEKIDQRFNEVNEKLDKIIGMLSW